MATFLPYEATEGVEGEKGRRKGGPNKASEDMTATVAVAAIEHRWKMMADHRYRRAAGGWMRTTWSTWRKKGGGGKATASLILLNVSAEGVVKAVTRLDGRRGDMDSGRTDQPTARSPSFVPE